MYNASGVGGLCGVVFCVNRRECQKRGLYPYNDGGGVEGYRKSAVGVLVGSNLEDRVVLVLRGIRRILGGTGRCRQSGGGVRNEYSF